MIEINYKQFVLKYEIRKPNSLGCINTYKINGGFFNRNPIRKKSGIVGAVGRAKKNIDNIFGNPEF